MTSTSLSERRWPAGSPLRPPSPRSAASPTASGPAGAVPERSAGGEHLHHYLWGIGMLAGVGASPCTARNGSGPRRSPSATAAGLALIVDEFALLLDLKDVYWARQGRFSVDVGIGGRSPRPGVIRHAAGSALHALAAASGEVAAACAGACSAVATRQPRRRPARPRHPAGRCAARIPAPGGTARAPVTRLRAIPPLAGLADLGQLVSGDHGGGALCLLGERGHEPAERLVRRHLPAAVHGVAPGVTDIRPSNPQTSHGARHRSGA